MLRIPLVALVLAAPLAAQCEPQTLIDETAGFNEWLGYVLHAEGDLAVAASTRDVTPGMGTGMVLVYEHEDGRWLQRQRLSPPSGVSHSVFGKSCSISGERILVGAYRHLGTGSGPAFVYDRGASGSWTLTQMLPNPTPAPHDVYATAVELDGDRAFVATPKDSSVVFEGGSVYEWTLGPNGWAVSDLIVPSDPEVAARFGSRVRADGDVLAVSAWWSGPGEMGSVYVFERVGGAWVERHKFEGDGAGQFDHYGNGLDLEGGRLVVGAPEDVFGPGSVYVYERGVNGWARTAKLQASDGELNDRFGGTVRLLGDRIIAGALNDDDGGGNSGAAYVFDLVDGVWVQSAKLVPEDAQISARTGEGLGVTEHGLLVGSPWSNGVATNSGRVHVFDLPLSIRPACFGAACPCGNDDTLRGCANSSGAGARLLSCGTSRVSAADLTLVATGLPPGEFGVICMGGADRLLPLGDGLGCVGGGALGIVRFPAEPVGADGTLTVAPTASAGETWHFQAWYRDAGGPCGAGYNLSNSLVVTFVP